MAKKTTTKSGAKKVTKYKNQRGGLSQDLILRNALSIIDRDGLAGLTVRKLAVQLEVSTMAVYRHYKNKAAIEHELVDLVVGDYNVTNHDEQDWRDWICTTYSLMRHALCAHPGIIPLLDSATYSGSNALAVMEKVLDKLHKAKLSEMKSAQLFHSLMAYTIGSVVLMSEASRSVVIADTAKPKGILSKKQRQQKLGFEMVSKNQYPNIVKLATHLARASNNDQFTKGLRQLLSSV